MNTPSALNTLPAVVVVPWWRVGVMWLVVGGLGVVVAGSFALLAAALRDADAVVPQEIAQVASPKAPHAPALQARNHAATPAL
jgi:hypothetical protein